MSRPNGREYGPRHLAAPLGLACDESYPADAESTLALGCYPTSVLDRVGALIEAGELSPAAAADLLGVSLEQVLGELLGTPEPAGAEEAREFAELPEPAPPRGRGRHPAA